MLQDQGKVVDLYVPRKWYVPSLSLGRFARLVPNLDS